MSTQFLVKKPSPGLSVSVIKKSANGTVITEKVCTGMGYVECVLNHADEVIELRLIEKIKPALEKPSVMQKIDKAAAKEATKATTKPATKAVAKTLEARGPAVPANPAVSEKALV